MPKSKHWAGYHEIRELDNSSSDLWGKGCYYQDKNGATVGHHDCFTCPYPDCIYGWLTFLKRKRLPVPKELLKLKEAA